MLNIGLSLAGFGISYQALSGAYDNRTYRPTGEYDADAAAYFARIENPNSTIGDTARLAINTFVTGCKSDGIWNLMLDVGPLCGSSLSGAMVKLKAISGSYSYRPVNFREDNYGQSSGIWGETTTYLGTNVTPSNISTTSFTMAVYIMSPPNAVAHLHGCIGANNDIRTIWYCPHSDNKLYSNLHQAPTNEVSTAALSGPLGLLVATRTPTPLHRIYRNGTGLGSSSSVGGTAPPTEFVWMGYNTNGTYTSLGKLRYGFFCLGSGMSSGDVGLLYTRVQALQTALGRNV